MDVFVYPCPKCGEVTGTAGSEPTVCLKCQDEDQAIAVICRPSDGPCVPGSIVGQCTGCHQDIWLSPDTQVCLKTHKLARAWCIECTMKLHDSPSNN
jgi:hypothetical protein